MPVMDEFREERQALKNKSLKDKLSYFFDYYKWHTLAVIVLIAVVISLVSSFINHKDWGFYVCLLNTSSYPWAETYVQNFAEYAEIDTGEYEVVFDTDMFINADMTGMETAATLQKITTYAMAGDIDVMIAGSEFIERYANGKNFHNLRDILTPEQLALCEPYFYYVDQTVVDAVAEANKGGQTYELPYPDPKNPDAMENPVPVGIYLDNCAALKENFNFLNEEMVLGVYVNTSRTDIALKFIDYIMEGNSSAMQK